MNQTDRNFSKIYIFNLYIKLFNYKLNKNLFNRIVFNNVRMTSCTGTIISIDKETFTDMINMRILYMTLYHSSKFMRIPIDWIKSMNKNVSINDDPNSLVEFLKHNISSVKFLYLYFMDYMFVDQDLCFFKDFPHQNAIYPIVYESIPSCSCTYIWLSKIFLFTKKY